MDGRLPGGRSRGMRVQSIRFSEQQWGLLQEIAASTGVSAGQFVRESAVAHALVVAVRQGGAESIELWMETLELLDRHGGDTLEVAFRHHAELRSAPPAD